MKRSAATILLSLLLMTTLTVTWSGCSDNSNSSENQALEEQLAAVTAERDALAAEIQAAADRYQRAKSTQDKVIAIIADPQEFGTEEEVLAMLKEAAVPGLVSVDEAFGSVDWVQGWKYTLFAGADAEIKTWRTWLSDDGSVGGSLWTWSGTAQNGKPFEIQGVEITQYDENGLCADVVMFYPYSDEEVQRCFREGN